MNIKNPEKIAKDAKKSYDQGKYLEAAEGFNLARNSYEAQNNPMLAAEMANNQSVALLQAGEAELSLEAVSGTDRSHYQECYSPFFITFRNIRTLRFFTYGV